MTNSKPNLLLQILKSAIFPISEKNIKSFNYN